MIFILGTTNSHLQLCIELAVKTSFMLFIGCATFCCIFSCRIAACCCADEHLEFIPHQDSLSSCTQTHVGFVHAVELITYV